MSSKGFHSSYGSYGSHVFHDSQSSNDSLTSRIYNTNTSHPLIQNTQEYIFYKKYVSIHSEDRDILKYPVSSDFEIELPEDLLNVASLRLYDWCFPCIYDTFSTIYNNVTMTFLINNPYNPNINGLSDLLAQKIFECLFLTGSEEYTITIENGFYNPQQIATEISNKFNTAVTNRISLYFLEKSTDSALSPAERQSYTDAITLFNAAGGYTNFIIVYNMIGMKLWFGNISDGFILTNETQFINSTLNNNIQCPQQKGTINIPYPPYKVPEYTNWGLPSYLGLSKCNTESISGADAAVVEPVTTVIYNSTYVPRFFYGNALNPGDNGYWLLPNPNLPGSQVYWIQSHYKINIMGQSHIYMELGGQNLMDETSPYNISAFTLTTNQTNGIVNSAFAKIPVITTPLSQWFDKDQLPYKYYYPPAERMRKFHIRFRYHNGMLVDFGTFNYSITIEFTLQVPQILRNSSDSVTAQIYPPY
jgi:hypothetical protein